MTHNSIAATNNIPKWGLVGGDTHTPCVLHDWPFLQYLHEMNHFLGGVCVSFEILCVDFTVVSKVLVFLIFIFICSQKEQLQKQQQHQLISNGKSPERSESPNSTSTATSAGTVTPPVGKVIF
jgi:hypothetical protein